ncbi:Sterile alpha motif domain [Sesbania bispinosa]|nr:Sterile alpha motif domain [Sesbania bispinosa]
MAAEPETTPPPEPPISSLPETAPETAEAPESTAQPTAEIPAGPPTKRQRRPSVRLGEIGVQRAATHGNDSHHTRRPNIPPWSWRTLKEPSRTTSKARSVTNLANGGEEFGNNNNIRRGKAKRGSATKRLRSDWASRTIDENGDKGLGFRDFDHDQDHNSPVHSVEENGFDCWQVDRNDENNRVRVSENESESRERRKNEGVRSWLFELGLSRYAPMFEIHEVDDELLPMLTLEDLKDMGISAVGSRRKMYTAIQKLRKGFP